MNILGTIDNREHMLDIGTIGLPRNDLDDLGAEITPYPFITESIVLSSVI
jgi:hypothetical protein